VTFTYSGNPLGSPRDQVRFLIGDVDSASVKLSDEEIAFLIVEWENDLYLAAAAAADIVSNNAAAYYNYSSDNSSSSIGELQERYRVVARNLRQTRNARTSKVFYVGGIDRSDVWKHDQDVSVVHPDFGTGMHDNLREGGVSGGATRAQLRGEDY
jgi:hypothetical protein